jgi:torulene dioxygenase
MYSRGSLYRGAAGSWDSGNYTAEHWFDGFSRNHRFEISKGKVEYRNRNATDELRDCQFLLKTGVMLCKLTSVSSC